MLSSDPTSIDFPYVSVVCGWVAVAPPAWLENCCNEDPPWDDDVRNLVLQLNGGVPPNVEDTGFNPQHCKRKKKGILTALF